LRSTPEGCYSKVMEKTKSDEVTPRWDPEVTTAAQMKEVISSRKLQKTPRSPRSSGSQRYWDEGRVLKVGFLLVFVRAFARTILKGFSKFSPVVMFLFFALLGGGTLSLMENFKGPEGSEVVREFRTPLPEVVREGRRGDSGGPTGSERVSVGGIELYEP